MPGAHQILYTIIFSLLTISDHALPHSKSLRAVSHHHQPEISQGMPSPATRNQQIEEQFMMWVRWMGTLNHTLFETAMNKVYPSFVLTVDKNPPPATLGPYRPPSIPCQQSTREKVNIPATKSFITIEGAGADRTVVEWGDTAQTLGPNGHPIGTFNSATFAVNSPFFIAKNITFKNTTPVPPPGAVGKQAVALRISGDTAAFVGCKFLGGQDTLYDHLGRHYYKDCYIEGSVDFIFGNGLSFFEGCHVHAIAQNCGALTAQNRMSLLDDTGFSFVNCRVTGSGVVYLGRAWGTFSRVIYAYTYMDNIVIPQGWYNWGDPSREMTVFYGQYKCLGPGANYAGRVAWSRELTDEEARPFINLNFVDGTEWIKI